MSGSRRCMIYSSTHSWTRTRPLLMPAQICFETLISSTYLSLGKVVYLQSVHAACPVHAFMLGVLGARAVYQLQRKLSSLQQVCVDVNLSLKVKIMSCHHAKIIPACIANWL